MPSCGVLVLLCFHSLMFITLSFTNAIDGDGRSTVTTLFHRYITVQNDNNKLRICCGYKTDSYLP